ncbi:hypothetical protein CCDG5_0778 [[Clostridium] cellulosi]|uniref:N-acetyltransferase domain-containing protein n=1 Tax=[Clostridium] cellulosi TaxID=29343 RepID=A0A078KN23_9FIRM|nr:hypothetical protein CCDG5_0778 [[Clostridium] cellulosi]
MAGKFRWMMFKDVNLCDDFFAPLKADYKDFSIWFKKKSDTGEKALVFHDEIGVGAFVYLKLENESIVLSDRILPSIPRLKIGTLRLAERFRGKRFGEGALGVSLWYWQNTKTDEVYITTYEKHTDLIYLLKRFGFVCAGKNKNKELVFIKNRHTLDYSNPYLCFPFISPSIKKAGILPIYDRFHDRLFPYSELKGQNQIIEETAGNGVTKIYICAPYSAIQYSIGEPVFIYRIHTGSGTKSYKSVVTSYCTITKVDVIKSAGKIMMSLDEFIKGAGNKTVFTNQELTTLYNKKNNNLIMIEMVYNGFFGKGKNITYRALSDQGLFPTYPYNIQYNKDQFIKILEMGGADVSNIIIN